MIDRVFRTARVPASLKCLVREPSDPMNRDSTEGQKPGRTRCVGINRPLHWQKNRKGISMSFKRIVCGAIGAIMLSLSTIPSALAEVKIGLSDWPG